jgi:hypothetical protein
MIILLKFNLININAAVSSIDVIKLSVSYCKVTRLASFLFDIIFSADALLVTLITSGVKDFLKLCMKHPKMYVHTETPR